MLERITIIPAIGGFILKVGGHTTVAKNEDDMLRFIRTYLAEPDRIAATMLEEAVKQGLYPRPPGLANNTTGYADTAPPPTHPYPQTVGLAGMSIVKDYQAKNSESPGPRLPSRYRPQPCEHHD